MSTWTFNDNVFDYEQLIDDTGEGWVGLRRFGYDLVSFLKPTTIIELGTYKGTSFFSFAQAIKDKKLKTKLMGIDTWEGDIQTGFYSQEVYVTLKKVIKKHYSKQTITLNRKTFDEALSEVKDRSIDLLHIDGLHTFKAVSHDYETWKNKVSPNGVILFYDIHYFERKFGVYKLWEALKKTHPTLELTHSNGLGILFQSKKMYNELKSFEPSWQAYYPVKAENDALKRSAQTQKNAKEIARYQHTIADLQQQLKDIRDSRFYRLWRQYTNVKETLIEPKK